jgi:hypothetical protein
MLRVRAADGHEWTIRRRLRLAPPRWRRFRPEVDASDPSWWPDSSVSSLSDLVVWLLLVVFLALAIVFLLPLVAFAAEAALLGLAAAVVGGTWTIEARRDDPDAEALRWNVRGWRGSRRLMRELAGRLAREGRLTAGEPAGGLDAK